MVGIKVPILVALTGGYWFASGQSVRPAPRNPHGPLKTACESCHVTSGWSPIRSKPEFNHNQETRFPLRGMHEGVACSSCHVNKVFASTATAVRQLPCRLAPAPIRRRRARTAIPSRVGGSG